MKTHPSVTTRSPRASRRAARGLLAAASATTLVALALHTSAADAHGFVGLRGSGELMARVAMPENASLVGNAQWEPQSLEAPKGYPDAPNSPKDGQIASAGGTFGGLLDKQSANVWAKQNISPGVNKIVWTYTAPHSTAGWQYYITKNGWDPNAPLTRAQFESKPIAVIKHDGSAANTVPEQYIDVPSDHTGYQVILAIWDIGDTPMAFYNVIDVNISGSAPAPDTEAPSAPGVLQVGSRTSTSISLAWQASTDNTGVDGYRVSRDGRVVGTTTNLTYVDSGLEPGSKHVYTVTAIDANDNESAPSNEVTAQTEAPPSGGDKEAPTAPSGLRSTGKTATTVDLAWTASTDNVGVAHYNVMRATNGGQSTKVGQVAGGRETEYRDTSASPGTRYTYSVVALDAAGNSTRSDSTLDVTTDSSEGGGDGDYPAWDAKAAYKIGDRVSHEGQNYECVQSYQGHGDPGWIDALSLWKPIGSSEKQSDGTKSDSSTSTSEKVAVSGTVKITGTAKVGKKLTAEPGKASGAKITYQWLSNGNAISKATSKSFKVTKSQKGKKIQVRVRYAKSGHTTVTQVSAAKKAT